MYTEIINIARKYGSGVCLAKNGVVMVTFFGINGKHPILITEDEGKTWCPEALMENHPCWSGSISLTGESLFTEIRSMFQTLNLGDPVLVLAVAEELSKINTGKVFH